MKQANIRAALETEHRELLGGINDREDIRIENAADALDNLQWLMNREVVIRTLDSESALLRQKSAALLRLEGERSAELIKRFGCEAALN